MVGVGVFGVGVAVLVDVGMFGVEVALTVPVDVFVVGDTTAFDAGVLSVGEPEHAASRMSNVTRKNKPECVMRDRWFGFMTSPRLSCHPLPR